MRDGFGAVRSVGKAGCPGDSLPPDCPPGTAASPLARRGVAAGASEAIPHDLRMTLRLVGERAAPPTAALLDGRTLPSAPAGGGRAGAGGAKRPKGSKGPGAVDAPGNRRALKGTAADEPERARGAEWTQRVRGVPGGAVEVAFVGQGPAGEAAAKGAEANGMRREVVRQTEAKKGLVRLPRRWVVEGTFGWLGRFGRLARADAYPPPTTVCPRSQEDSIERQKSQVAPYSREARLPGRAGVR